MASSSTDASTDAATATATSTTSAIDELTEKVNNMDVDEDPTLQAGELNVRLAGNKEASEFEDLKVFNFDELDIHPLIKKAIIEKKGWQVMSKIQQIGLPLALKSPPTNMLAQAQAGTGKTGTFVLSILSRIDTNLIGEGKQKPSTPQGIIIAVTQELVTQIASEVNSLGYFIGVTARRVMSSSNHSRDGGNVNTSGVSGGRGNSAGRGMFANAGVSGGRGRGSISSSSASASTSMIKKSAEDPNASWALKDGEDFNEAVVVGTATKIYEYLKNSKEENKKPCIYPNEVRVLVVDEADQVMGSSHKICIEIKRIIGSQRKGKDFQILLFSATYSNEMRILAKDFVGDNDYRKYNEITLSENDLVLNKLDNFYIEIQTKGKRDEEILETKIKLIMDIWSSLSLTTLKGQTVIFVRTKKDANYVATKLRQENFDIGLITGEMNRSERDNVFKEFKENKRPAIVSTNVLARGIDNQNVTLVINLDLPLKSDKSSKLVADPETFIHRIGRAGRWNKRGASISIVSSDIEEDILVLSDIEKALFSGKEEQRSLIQIFSPDDIGKYIEERRKAQAQSASSSSSSSSAAAAASSST